jgi:hypothetical protein
MAYTMNDSIQVISPSCRAMFQRMAPAGWIVWKYGTAGADGKRKKVPYTLDGRKKYGNTPPTYTYEQVTNAYQTFDGIGVYITAPLVGIDLDGVVSWPDGADGAPQFTPDALHIMRMIPSYVEYSPSRTGVHIWCRVTELHQIKNINPKNSLPHGGTIEMYTGNSHHYFTVTHDAVNETAMLLDMLPSDIEAIRTTYGEPAPASPHHTPPPVTTTSATPALHDPHDGAPVPDAIAPHMAPYGIVDTHTTIQRTATNRPPRRDRLIRFISEYWPRQMQAAIDDIRNAGAGGYHSTRYMKAYTIGATLRALEMACVDDMVVTALYNAKPPTNEHATERRTIQQGIRKAYAGATSWRDAAGAGGALTDIMAATDTPQRVTAPASPHHTPPPVTTTSATAPKAPTTPPDGAPAPAVTGGGVSIFDDILQPHAGSVDALKARIEAHGGAVAADDIYTTPSQMMAKVSDAPRPVIASTTTYGHLLMQGVTQLSAASKAGKSTVALHLAWCVATGSPTVFASDDYTVNDGGIVVYVDCENNAGITGGRLHGYDTLPDDTLHIINATTWQTIKRMAASDGHDQWRAMQWCITDAIRRWPEMRLLILDNVLQFQPKRTKHEALEDIEERYLWWLAGVADDNHLAILIIDHNTKATADDNDATAFAKAHGTFRKQAWLTGGMITMQKPAKKETMADGTPIPDDAVKIRTSMRACADATLIVRRDDTRGHHVVLGTATLALSVVQRRVYNAIRNGATTTAALVAALPDMAKSHILNTNTALVAKGHIYKIRHGEYGITHTTQQTIQHTNDESEAF